MYLCLLEAVYMAPIATAPGTGNPLCTQTGFGPVAFEVPGAGCADCIKSGGGSSS